MRLGSVALLLSLACVATACSSNDEGVKRTATPAEEKLRAKTGVDWVVDENPILKTPDLVAPLTPPAPYLRDGEKHRDAALRFLEENKDLFRLDDVERSLRVVDEDVDGEGLAHVKLEQIDHDVPVIGGGYTVHFTDAGAIAFVNGMLDLDPAPESLEPELPSLPKPPDAIDGAKLVWVRPSGSSHRVLAWETTRPGSRERVRVAVRSGVVVSRSPVVHEVTTGKGVRYFAPISDPKDTKPLVVEQTTGRFVLKQSAAKGRSEVSVLKAAPIDGPESSEPQAPISSEDGQTWDPIAPNVDGAGAAVDAHYHLSQIDRWYREKLDWASYDGKGGKITAMVHDNAGFHAAYVGLGTIVCSDGDALQGGDRLPWVSLMILAHELTHGVAENTSRFDGTGEAGVLNESIADVFAALVFADLRDEKKALLLAHDGSVSGKAVRDMLHPSRVVIPPTDNGEDCHYPAARPDHLSKAYKGDCDSGGVHFNAGIPNNAFALMTVGGKNDTSGIAVSDPLGWDDARLVWWASLRYMARATTGLSELARWQIVAAKRLGLAVEPVACAWVATGVVENAYVERNWNVSCR